MVLLRSLVLSLLVLAGLALMSGATASPVAADPAAALGLQRGKGGECVRPTEWMRRNHMDFLKHTREVTVRKGVRVKQDSLLNCKTCHTSREQFCDKCHDYANVEPDCFQCHNYPK